MRGPTRELPIRQLDAVEPVYSYWTHVLANRARFTEDSRATLQERAIGDLGALGTPDFVQLLPSNVLEVSIPFENEETMWPARVCPWEGLLRFATKSFRDPDQPLVVVRELRRSTPVHETARPPAPPQTLLLVVSAPGELSELFEFSLESRIVTSALHFAPEDAARFRQLVDPSLEELARTVEEFRPEVIHLAGIDSHQSAALLQLPEDPRRFDGYVLRGPGGQPVSISAEPLAAALTASGKHAPSLVSFNFYNSGARLAALTVARGARAAIGFQDTVDDRTAEQFFGNFYTLWREMGCASLLEAFMLAQQQTASIANTRKNGDIILWNETSVFRRATPREVGLSELTRAFQEARRASVPWMQILRNVLGKLAESSPPAAPSAPSESATTTPPLTTPSVAGGAESPPAAPAPTPPAPPVAPPSATPVAAPGGVSPQVSTGTGRPREPRLHFTIAPLAALNYSLLHNQSAIFGLFQVEADDTDLPLEIEVRVELFSGEDSFVARSQHTLTNALTHLNELIHIPLTAAIMRSRREGIGTTLTADVYQGDRKVHGKTYPVRLLPADEWVDTPEDRCWLPSFVFPRDPAIQRIVGSGKNYLRVLADDSGAGFDGYQGIADDVDTTGHVERQARAVWSALLYEHPLAYINPPPTYTINSQRIRTPSQIMEEGLATCIDLALLYSSSLEFLGIMPVMFLIHGHAFPGYWRTPQAFENFWSFGYKGSRPQTPHVPVGSDGKPRALKPWEVELGGFPEIMRAIESGDLVPLETTAITRHEPFQAARELGVKNLLTNWGFDVMVDITKARAHGVTPLPLLHQDL